MKAFRKLLVFTLVAVMVLALGTATAFAAENEGTLTVTNATKGQTYKAYKVFNAVYTDASDISKGVSYTVPSDKEQFVTAPFSVGTAVASNGEKIVAVADGTTNADILAWVKTNYSKFDAAGTALTYNADGTASATLPYGYYYVTSTLGSVITIDSLNTAVSIVDKNESTPAMGKKVITAEDSSIIAGLDQTGVSLTANDAAVGSVESYKVDFNATNWVQTEESDTTDGTGTGTKTKVTEVSLTDTPVGLDIKASTVKVTVNGTELAATAYTVTGGGTSALQVTIPWTDQSGASLYETKTAGSELIPVVITYDAEVTSAAATAQASNTAVVKYNSTQIGTDQKTTTDTYKFDLKKVDETKAALPGAQFQLYASDGTTLLKFDQNGTTYTYNPTGTVDTIDMTENATVTIQGLDNADYVLKEIKAPDGYTKAADKTVMSSMLKKESETAGVVEVENKKGTELPSTGGRAWIVYMIGGILIVGGCTALVIRRKVSAR